MVVGYATHVEAARSRDEYGEYDEAAVDSGGSGEKRATGSKTSSETDMQVPFRKVHRQGRAVGGVGRGMRLCVGPWRWALQEQVMPVEVVSAPQTPPWNWQTPHIVIAEEGVAKRTARVLQDRMPNTTAVVLTDGSRKDVRVGQAGVGAAAFGSSNHPLDTVNP